MRGTRGYRIRFAKGKLPPADAFWSLTMYDTEGFLHPNPLRRYAIGDRTAGLRRGRDGSLTLAIQSARPEGLAEGQLAPRPARSLPHDHADLRAAAIRAHGALAAPAA